MLFPHSPLAFLKLSGPKSIAGKEARRGGAEGGSKRGRFPLDVSCSVHKRFQASRSRRGFSANTAGRALDLFLTDHEQREAHSFIATRVKCCEKH